MDGGFADHYPDNARYECENGSSIVPADGGLFLIRRSGRRHWKYFAGVGVFPSP